MKIWWSLLYFIAISHYCISIKYIIADLNVTCILNNNVATYSNGFQWMDLKKIYYWPGGWENRLELRGLSLYLLDMFWNVLFVAHLVCLEVPEVSSRQGVWMLAVEIYHNQGQLSLKNLPRRQMTDWWLYIVVITSELVILAMTVLWSDWL